MGTKKLLTNDRRWNEKFRQNILQDYEKRQDERERQLADREVQRVLQLKLQGIIPANDDFGDRDGHHKLRNNKTRTERKWDRRSHSNQIALYRQPLEGDLETQMEILQRDENEFSHRGQRSEDNEEGHSETPHCDNAEEEEKDGKDEQNPHIDEEEEEVLRSARVRRVERKLNNPELDKLYEEESLESMYQEAARLVRISHQTKTPK